jgi:hypothetical protein
MGLLDIIFNKKVEVKNLDNQKNRPIKRNEVFDVLTRSKQDVGKWRLAVEQAERYPYFNRTEYYRMLKDVVLDAHLSSVIDQRKSGVLCRETEFYNADGTENEEITALFEKSWFVKMRNMVLDAKYYGFTMIDLGPIINDGFPLICEIPRQYVKPELGIVTAEPWGGTGVDIDNPMYAKWNIFIGEREDLGLLMKAAPWTLWKKTIISYWSEYCEKFGMPMRIGKTNVNDEALRDNMYNELKNMGSAFTAVLNTDDEIQILETFSTAAYDIYDKFIDRANSEISKLILSQTGTTDEKSFTGSANVHQDVLGSLIERDIIWHDAQFNEIIKPVLISLGFKLGDGYFETKCDEEQSLKEKVEMVTKFMPFVKFDKTYLEEKFGIVIESVLDKTPVATPPTKIKAHDLRKYYDSL